VNCAMYSIFCALTRKRGKQPTVRPSIKEVYSSGSRAGEDRQAHRLAHCRRTFTTLLKNGADVKVMQELLRHAIGR
jgi:site-specific recombinase XerD